MQTNLPLQVGNGCPHFCVAVSQVLVARPLIVYPSLQLNDAVSPLIATTPFAGAVIAPHTTAAMEEMLHKLIAQSYKMSTL